MNQSAQHKKLLFTGPVGAGKTTAIQSMSDVPIVSTNESATDMTKSGKKTQQYQWITATSTSKEKKKYTFMEHQDKKYLILCGIY